MNFNSQYEIWLYDETEKAISAEDLSTAFSLLSVKITGNPDNLHHFFFFFKQVGVDNQSEHTHIQIKHIFLDKYIWWYILICNNNLVNW